MDWLEDLWYWLEGAFIWIISIACSVAIVGIIVAVPLYFFGVFDKYIKPDDPVISKVELCEFRAKEMLGGSPQFERGTEEIKNNVYVITGKVTTTFDTSDAAKTYTCTVEIVDGKSIAEIDSIK